MFLAFAFILLHYYQEFMKVLYCETSCMNDRILVEINHWATITNMHKNLVIYDGWRKTRLLSKRFHGKFS
jgi:hypothetical protein